MDLPLRSRYTFATEENGNARESASEKKEILARGLFAANKHARASLINAGAFSVALRQRGNPREIVIAGRCNSQKPVRQADTDHDDRLSNH